MGDQSGRTAIVTGANSGIGFETARELATHGASVVLACRNADAAEKAAQRIGSRATVMPLDLARMDSVREFGERWDRPLDLLVNNGGVMAPPRRAETADGFELQFGTNHLGHFVLTAMLLPYLLKSERGRVVTVSSIAHHGGSEAVLDANAGPYDARRTYAQSKLANLLFAMQLHRELSARELAVTSTAAHPGLAATGLATDAEGLGANRLVRAAAPAVLSVLTQSAAEGARASLFAATQAAAGSYSGPSRLRETRGPVGDAKLSHYARDERLGRRLWHVSEELTGLYYHWDALS